ncbi:MAG TPA: sodium:solute symporter [Terriglobales bacterium]|nr:sodium:solute symporter [Terriglobales bacterium]
MVAYLAGITAFGVRFRKQQRSLRDYFLADRNIPWWAIALSIVAAETSVLTIISIPGLAYDTDFGFLQLVLGYLVARVLICLLFIPQYFRGELFTAYQLIERRFGTRLRTLTAGIFLLTRAAAEGVRVYAVSIVVRFALGRGEGGPAWVDVAAIAAVLLLTLIYAFEGGMAAVIWTDVVQIVIYITGTVVAVFTLLHLVPGGWPAVHTLAGSAGKFRVFHFSRDLFQTYTFWAGLVGGTFLTMASHGTDQLIVQRLLAARSKRASKSALLASGLFILAQFALFLLVGALLFAFYRVFAPAAPFRRSDDIFPTFIVSEMPRGMAGLLVAAILAAAMSNLSAALNSLASSSVVDFYLRLRPGTGEGERLRLSRRATLLWGAALFVLALVFLFHGGRVVEVGLAIASIAYGALLGIFLLGVLTRRASQTGGAIGMACGLAIELYVARWTHVPWTWYVFLGTLTTFVIGYIASFVFPRQEANG